MLETILGSALLVEIGGWIGFASAKIGSAQHQRLIDGFDTQREFGMIDSHIAKQTTHATKAQRVVASRLAGVIRFFVNTRAFELLVLQKLGENWPGKPKDLAADVKLFG